jgi:FecR protein
MAAGCARAWEAEAVEDGRLSGTEGASFKRHAEVCSECAGEVRALARLRDGMARVPAPVQTPLERGRLRREMLRQANRGLTAAPARARVRRLGAAAAFAVVAAAVAIGRLGGGPVPRSNDAAVATVPSPSPGFRIQATPETEWLTVDSGPALRLALRRGQVTIAVDKLHAGQRFLVDLPDGELEVRGTRFVVDAEPGRTKAVRVLEGRVVIRFHGLPIVALGAGQAWHAPPIAASAPAQVERADPAAAGAHAVATSIAKKRVPASPVVARDGRSRAPASATGMGGLTESEAPPSQERDDSAGTAFGRAMAAFSAGDDRRAERMLLEFEAVHRGDPRAEDAAFLAAVARARAGDRAGSRALAQHYLERYPRGLRRAEAERLVR